MTSFATPALEKKLQETDSIGTSWQRCMNEDSANLAKNIVHVGVDTDVTNQFDNKATKNTQDLSDAKKDEDQKRTEDLETSTNLSDKQPPKRDETSSFQNEVV